MPEPSLETIRVAAKVPAISLAIVNKDGTIDSSAAGVTNTHSPNAVTNTTVFVAASLSKTFFAYLVLKLIASRALSRPGGSAESGLDRQLYENCDFGPIHLRNHPNYKQLTARLILSHQTGLPNLCQAGESEDYIERQVSVLVILAWATCF